MMRSYLAFAGYCLTGLTFFLTFNCLCPSAVLGQFEVLPASGSPQFIEVELTEQNQKANAELLEELNRSKAQIAQLTKENTELTTELSKQAEPQLAAEASDSDTPLISDDTQIAGQVADSETASPSTTSAEATLTSSEELTSETLEAYGAATGIMGVQLSGEWNLTQWIGMTLFGGLAMALLAIFKED